MDVFGSFPFLNIDSCVRAYNYWSWGALNLVKPDLEIRELMSESRFEKYNRDHVVPDRYMLWMPLVVLIENIWQAEWMDAELDENKSP